jgi:hypothetical protein
LTEDGYQTYGSGTLAQERLKVVETRALLKIDRERQVGARLQKELDVAARKRELG